MWIFIHRVGCACLQHPGQVGSCRRQDGVQPIKNMFENEKIIAEYTDIFTVYLVEDLEGSRFLKTWDFDSQDFYYRQFVEGKDMLQQIQEILI